MTRPPSLDAPLALDVVSDTICPWCFVGKRHLAAALAQLATEGLTFAVTWRPFQLNPDMPAGGVDRRTYRTAKFGSWERSLALDARLAEVGRRAGLAFRFDQMARTPNTVASHVLVALAHEMGGADTQDRVVEALFNEYFTRGGDVGDPGVLAAIGAGCGMDRAGVEAALADPGRAAAIVREDEGLRRQGFDGVPSFVMDGRFLFSGAEAADVMAQAFRRAAAWRADASRMVPGAT